MENNMKQFNLQEYLAHPERKVVTRDGRPVRIICTDSDAEGGPIIAIVTMANQSKQVLLYYENGKYFSLDSVSEDDLFFAPEKHEGWIIINKYPDGVRDTNGIIYHTKSDIPDIPIVGVKRVATIKIEWEE